MFIILLKKTILYILPPANLKKYMCTYTYWGNAMHFFYEYLLDINIYDQSDDSLYRGPVFNKSRLDNQKWGNMVG